MNNNLMFWSLLTIGIIFFLLGGCTQRNDSTDLYSTPDMVTITKAVAVIHPLNGSDVTGLVTFKKDSNGIEIIADISGLSPGKHGFHVHEYGDLENNNGSTAGGHFNPDDRPHGGPEMQMRHVGDFGNLVANENGKAHYERIDTEIAFTGAHSIIGRAIIIHSGEDDLTSQPSGNSGERIAGGVIGIANEK